ncbi:hypothetical protein EV188_101901 [Actinomycetospora succinea]|uniref:Uncharacterized protein n=1 Tax=Actinomycetospora succinea TaxID=663603 RepID=A0A4R6VP31_9PSEU|nr:hypothetical protein [Actinomycetospora succinea]TDQ65649.1 hypothetical protein EV188_101901 [Actinomycetospora succinea]
MSGIVGGDTRVGTPRRTVLQGAAAVVAVTGLAAAGCARDEGPDELEAPLAAARADAATAAAAAAAYPDLAARLTPVADARHAHADALAAEIRRARPDRAPVVDATPAPADRPASAAAALTALRGSLGTARDAAGALALTTASYRCGLLTSVAASCAGQATVLA